MRRPLGDRGSVTAEFAMILPAVVGLLALAVTLGTAGWNQARCGEAARSAARAASAGEDDASIRTIVREIAGAEAHLVLGGDDSWARAVVSRPVPLLGSVRAEAIALREVGRE